MSGSRGGPSKLGLSLKVESQQGGQTSHLLPAARVTSGAAFRASAPKLRGWEQQPTPVFLPGEFMDRGAWRAAVHGVARSRTRRSDFHTEFRGERAGALELAKHRE